MCIRDSRKSKAGNLSGGERRRLEIARCLVAEPKIIMLDEPFAGIDPVTVQSIQVVIRELADDGISILITDHAAREILQITDRTYVVSAGQILCSGSADEIVRHEVVREKYLGDIDIDSIGANKRETVAEKLRYDQGRPTGVSGSKIVFSKPRTKKLNRVPSPFKSDDLS